jgi:hypothetical protein
MFASASREADVSQLAICGDLVYNVMQYICCKNGFPDGLCTHTTLGVCKQSNLALHYAPKGDTFLQGTCWLWQCRAFGQPACPHLSITETSTTAPRYTLLEHHTLPGPRSESIQTIKPFTLHCRTLPPEECSHLIWAASVNDTPPFHVTGTVRILQLLKPMCNPDRSDMCSWTR